MTGSVSLYFRTSELIARIRFMSLNSIQDKTPYSLGLPPIRRAQEAVPLILRSQETVPNAVIAGTQKQVWQLKEGRAFQVVDDYGLAFRIAPTRPDIVA